jgi:hypothetical protein
LDEGEGEGAEFAIRAMYDQADDVGEEEGETESQRYAEGYMKVFKGEDEVRTVTEGRRIC